MFHYFLKRMTGKSWRFPCHSLQKIMKKCFFCITWSVILLVSSNIQPHMGVLFVAKELISRSKSKKITDLWLKTINDNRLLLLLQLKHKKVIIKKQNYFYRLLLLMTNLDFCFSCNIWFRLWLKQIII